MINALLLLVLAAGVHFFCDYSANQAKHHVSVTAKCTCVCYGKSSYFDRYARSHRPLRALTSTVTHVHIDFDFD